MKRVKITVMKMARYGDLIAGKFSAGNCGRVRLW